MKDNKKPINLYWCPGVFDSQVDFSFLYPKPKTLFKDIRSHKVETAPNDSLLACPAVSNKFKKILIFESAINCSYAYDFTEGKQDIKPTSETFLATSIMRPASLNFGPHIHLNLDYLFFSDEPLNAFFTAPYYHKPEHTKYGSIVPGEFDIGQWFRSYSVELQMWNQKGEFYLKEKEPLFYLELKTERPIHIRRFNNSAKTQQYATESALSTRMFGRGQSLFDRYSRFKKVGMREKILTEINKNLIDEDPFIV